MLPGGWVTLRDVYHCAIDKALFAKKIQQAQTYAAEMSDAWISVSADAIAGDHLDPLRAFGFKPDPADLSRHQTKATPAALTYLNTHTITHARERIENLAIVAVANKPHARSSLSVVRMNAVRPNRFRSVIWSVWGSGPAFRAGPFRLRRMGRRSSSARSITRSEPSRARLPNG